MQITRTTDTLGRDTGFSLADSDYAVTYGYDAYGRFHSVTSSVSLASLAVQYSYLPNSDLISGMSASSGFLWTRAYESARSLITSVENRFGETLISRYDYANDALGRRVSRADSGLAFANPAFDAYSYNGRSEVTGAQRYHGTDISDTSTVYGGRQFGYAYDPIGNRTSASETIGGETLAKAYTANAINQYTAIANPNAVGLRGDATNTAVVTVNGEDVQRDAIAADTVPWHYALEANNANGPDFPFAEIVAVVNPPGTNTPDIVSTSSGHLYAPPQNETLTYDLDGNLTSDGRWQYTWNGENRLIKAEEQVSPTNRQPYTVDYAYDHQGRMVWKQVSTNAVVVSSRSLLWDGYNIIQATIANQQSTITNAYVWGLDLSGSLQGAGGVGGLLSEVQHGVPYLAAFDANGNVTEYLSTNGTIAAHYEYSPFGEIVVQSGAMAASFTHRFSTKPWCPVTGMCEYEFRKYSPSMDRWLSRDPLSDHASPGARRLHGEIGMRMTYAVLVNLYTALDEDLDDQDRFNALLNTLYWVKGIQTLRAGDPSIGLGWYDRFTGDWLSTDPIGINGGLNQYGVYINSPLNFIDPYGLNPFSGINPYSVSKYSSELSDSAPSQWVPLRPPDYIVRLPPPVIEIPLFDGRSILLPNPRAGTLEFAWENPNYYWFYTAYHDPRFEQALLAGVNAHQDFHRFIRQSVSGCPDALGVEYMAGVETVGLGASIGFWGGTAMAEGTAIGVLGGGFWVLVGGEIFWIGVDIFQGFSDR